MTQFGRPAGPTDALRRMDLQGSLQPGIRTWIDVLRGLAALTVITALVVGLPLLLLVVAPVHIDGWPTWTGITEALTRPDDGHLFLATLTRVAWLAWAIFTLATVVEVAAILRGLPSYRLPLLAGPQHMAAALVAAAAVLLSSPTPAQAPPTVPAVSVSSIGSTVAPTAPLTATISPSTPPPTPSAPVEQRADNAAPRPLTDAPAQSTSRTVTVHRGDSLWSIAAEHLGSGARFREIAALNYGHRQADGRALSDAHWIYPGWVLRLPRDAVDTTPKRHQGTAAPHSPSRHVANRYTVRHGDNLWDIAARHLGDGQRYREIYQLNVGRPQPDGRHLSDPDLIIPGWILRLPAAPGTRDSATQPEPRTVQPAPPVTARPSAKPATAPAPAPSLTTPSPTPTSAPLPSATNGTGARASTDAPAVSREQESPSDDDGVRTFSRMALGLAAISAAGILAELARRRRRQQRLRRPGARIAMPDLEAAEAEQELRAVQDPMSLRTLVSSLDAMAVTAEAEGRPLPRLLAVSISADRIELTLDEAVEPIAPFAAGGNRTWTLQASHLVERDVADPETRPYPALLTIGTTDESVVLVNLEAAGTLTLAGDVEMARDVQRAAAVELATSPLTAGTSLVLPDEYAALADVSDPDRVIATENPAARIAARTAATAEALRVAGVTDVHDARSQRVAPDTWTPEVVLLDAPVAVASWSGVAALRIGAPADGEWVIQVNTDGHGWLLPLGLEIDLQRLSASDYVNVIDLLAPATETPEDGADEGDPPIDLTSFEDGHSPVPAFALNNRRAVVIAALPDVTDPIDRTEDADDRTTAPLETSAHTTPRVLLLGRVEIGGLDERGGGSRRARPTELLAYLVLHPGATPHELDEAIWRGERVTNNARNSFVGRARTWLGNDPTGQPYLPFVIDDTGYRLSPSVTSDWHEFLRLARRGLSRGDDGVADLRRALELVRGRPFLGVDPATYTWAERDTQEMISAIVDVAHELATISLALRDADSAHDAAARGLLADPASEQLHRDAINAAALRGDVDEVDRLAARLRAQIRAIDPDGGLSDETIELLRTVGRR
ncbi:MAG: LysM peptidoglycan-binding domain-containing protein [Actinobacteria bacterium]|nr:LysM peptidoglycan-binding domain-containing protein [Actinomycetota bacterium]